MSDINEYDANGIYIAYPKNWTLREESMNTDGGLTINSPQGAFWILKLHPSGTDPETLAKDVLSTMREQYPDMEIDKIEREVFGISVLGFEMNFFYLDWTSTAIVQCFAGSKATYAVFWQTADRMVIGSEDDAAPTEKVFEAITFAMLKRLKDTEK